MNQLDFLNTSKPAPTVDRVTKYQSHSETSRASAHAIESHAATLRGKVYRWLLGAGQRGATDEEMQLELNLNPSTQRPRRVELVERRLVINSGLCRRTKSARLAVVWTAKTSET